MKIFNSKTFTFLGDVNLYADDNNLLFVELPDCNLSSKLKYLLYKSELTFKKNDIILKAEEELEKYFRGELRTFTIPIKFINETKLSIKVLKTLIKKVPFGKLISYKELSELSNIKNGARFIGNVMSKNNLPIFVPCHRVIKSNGEIGGYSTSIDIKLKLINFERMCSSK